MTDIFALNSKNPFRLEGELALITGGATGLGLAMAHCLVASGAKVVLAGRRESELQKAVALLGPQSGYETHDVTDHRAAPRLIETMGRRWGGSPSILINNAGIHLKKPSLEVSAEEFSGVLNTHVIGSHALTSAVLPAMIERKHGNVIFIASMASLFGIPKVVAYSAAKSAYLGMVRTWATEVSGFGVRINAIAPGWIDSEMMRTALNGDPARRDKILARTPMGRFGEGEDIGWAAVYLCSTAAKFVTGTVLPVDGGVSIGF